MSAAPKRRALSRELIVEVALGVVDTDGLDALSMRRVSQELNTGPASLYAHVGSKEELVGLVLDRVSAELEHPVADPAHWREQLKDFLTRARDDLVAHNDLARAAMISNTPTLPHRLDAAETVATLLKAGGLPDRVVAHGTDLLALYLVASAYEASRRRGPKTSPEQAEAEEYPDGLRGYLASMPADRYPVLLTMLPEMARDAGDERWEFGIDVILAGMEHSAGRLPGAGRAE
ncbi:TetR/AcrR family transcriptional regulator [Streptacidiphilus cavernicola]|uniref:TetR/AcrR family transcriptional regulator n=1 Tax=Streptacidiphilus cavernicola TaxID=3342716 RepID=A0ABV6W0Q8_9ACTN